MPVEKVLAVKIDPSNPTLKVYTLPQIISATNCKHSVTANKSTLTIDLNFDSELLVTDIEIADKTSDYGYILIDGLGNVPIKTSTNSNGLKFSTDINAAILELHFTIGAKIGGTTSIEAMDGLKIGGTTASETED